MKQLDSIPFSFEKLWSSKCYCCDTIKTETVTYELQVRFILHIGHENKENRTYLLFYTPRFYCSFSKNPPVIGTDTGMGKRDIEELVEEIKKLI